MVTRIKKQYIVIAVLLIVLVAVSIYIYSHYSSNSVNKNQPITLTQFQRVHSQSTNVLLKNKDYVGYQDTQSEFATQYIGFKNYSAAESVMNDVFKKVPQDKIDSGSYLTMYSLEKAKGDTTQEKRYLQLLITTLKTEGDTADAADYQIALDKLK